MYKPSLLLLLAMMSAPSVGRAASAPAPQFFMCVPQGEDLLCTPAGTDESTDLGSDTSRAKSPRRAAALSGLGTLAMAVPVVNFVAIPAGPALGHFYAGNTRQAWIGIGIRGGAFVSGVTLAILSALSAGTTSNDRTETYLGGMLAVILISAVYDTATAPAAARRYNRAHGLRMSVVPMVGQQPGVRLAVRM